MVKKAPGPCTGAWQAAGRPDAFCPPPPPRSEMAGERLVREATEEDMLALAGGQQR